MAKRSPQTFVKRQREMDKKRKAEIKRQRRIERRDVEPDPDREARPLRLDENGFPID